MIMNILLASILSGQTIPARTELVPFDLVKVWTLGEPKSSADKAKKEKLLESIAAASKQLDRDLVEKSLKRYEGVKAFSGSLYSGRRWLTSTLVRNANLQEVESTFSLETANISKDSFDLKVISKVQKEGFGSARGVNGLAVGSTYAEIRSLKWDADLGYFKGTAKIYYIDADKYDRNPTTESADADVQVYSRSDTFLTGRYLLIKAIVKAPIYSRSPTNDREKDKLTGRTRNVSVFLFDQITNADCEMSVQLAQQDFDVSYPKFKKLWEDRLAAATDEELKVKLRSDLEKIARVEVMFIALGKSFDSVLSSNKDEEPSKETWAQTQEVSLATEAIRQILEKADENKKKGNSIGR